LVNTLVSYQNGSTTKKSVRSSEDVDTKRVRDGGERSMSIIDDGEDGFLAGIGRTGVGRAQRAFLALRVGAGHDEVRGEGKGVYIPPPPEGL
jgi:hypothetical protein